MQTLMIEPVGGSCNLNCDYCYQDPVRRKMQIMPRRVLERITPDKVALGDKIKFLWHGGEPLLAGIDFFRYAVKLQKEFNRRGIKVKNSIQTNAILIDREWAQFFAENDFKVRTSLDGPADLHSICRGDNFDRVICGIRHIQESGKDVGVVITISKHNVDFPERIWKEVIENKQIATSFETNICSSTETSNLVPDMGKALSFWTRLFDLWLAKDDPTICIKTFRVLLRFILGGNAGDCAFEYNKCNQFAAIDEKGDVYICNRFMKREIAHLGNILEYDLREITTSEKARKLYHQIACVKEECRSCEWLMCCGGGCAFQRWVHTGRFDAGFPECELRKALFSYIRDNVTRLSD
jgi:uncharacterized protein